MSKKKRGSKPVPKPPSREGVMRKNDRDRAIYELWKSGLMVWQIAEGCGIGSSAVLVRLRRWRTKIGER